ncbi:response regulator transcription factor [Parvibium lacunae]|uniref:Response regulator n=1 Tax=Parvibium lacunae TaxID=1888893 RepID=A0A368L7Z9_9BURK|nr:response regulator [Parvibium lacunae]RCS59800.1 response regulator [Parvibium lacunae]
MTDTLQTQPNIMIVDDSRVSRMMLRAMVQNLCPTATIQEAADGEEALQVVAGFKPDLLIIDYNMPKMTGLDFALACQAQHPQAKYALLTANVQDSTKARAEEIGVVFFRKPIIETTVKAILALLN